LSQSEAWHSKKERDQRHGVGNRATWLPKDFLRGSSVLHLLYDLNERIKELACALPPRVQKFDPASFEVCYVARGELRPKCLNDRSDLSVELADRFSLRMASRRNLRKSMRRVTIEWENRTPEVLRKHCLGRCEQPRFASTLRQKFDAVEDLRLGNCGDPKPGTRSRFDPANNLGGRRRPHELGENVCIEQNHLRKVGASRIASRVGIFSSTPWNGANRLLIDSARSHCSDSRTRRELRNISRASSSIDRPCLAACIRSPALVFSSSLRMVNVGKQQC